MRNKEEQLIKLYAKTRKQLNLGVVEVLQLASMSYERNGLTGDKDQFLERLERELIQ